MVWCQLPEGLMMLNRLLNVPGLEHGMPNIRVNLCLLVLRPTGSMVLQGSSIISAPEILWSTPPLHISGGGHWKARSLVWNLLFLLSVFGSWFGCGRCWESITLEVLVWKRAVFWAVCHSFVLFPQVLVRFFGLPTNMGLIFWVWIFNWDEPIFCLRCIRSNFLTSSPSFARNLVYCLLLSLFIGKVWALLMHFLQYLIAFRSL